MKKQIFFVSLLLALPINSFAKESMDDTCEARVKYYRLCYDNDKEDCDLHRPERNCFPPGSPELNRPSKYPEPAAPKALPASDALPDQRNALEETNNAVQEGEKANKAEQKKTDLAERDADKDAQSKLDDAERLQAEQEKKAAKDKKKRALIEKWHEAIVASREAVKHKKALPKEKIEQVSEPEIKKKLVYVAAAQDAQEAYRKKKKGLARQLTELFKLEEKISAKQMLLNSSPQKRTSVSAGMRPTKEYIYVKENAGGNAVATAEGKSSESKALSVPLEVELGANGKPTEKWRASAEQKLKRIKELSREEPLNQKVKAEAAALESALAMIDLPGSNPQNAKSPATKVALDALDSVAAQEEKVSNRARSWRHYSLANATAEAEVTRRIEELEAAGEMNAAADLRTGIMEEESATLFDRINEVVRECARRGCVISH